MPKRNALLPIAFILAAALPAAAQGIMIPKEADAAPLSLQKHRVRIEIDRQAATTTVEQVFLNSSDRQLEAVYVFPIPRGAAMSRFTMLVNGQEKAGEIVEKNEARRIYNQIVHRSQDPGLLEYLGGELFRANIFPILPRGSQTVTLRFEQVLPAQDRLIQYVYPVRGAQKSGPALQGEFSIEASVKSGSPILNLFSPSHTVDVQRPNDREAKLTYTQRRATLEKDFQLFYSVADREVGLDLVTYRPDPQAPGYYMLLVAPKSTLQAQRLVERDVVFVIDTSGSMAGDKIKQARNALKYLVEKLNDGDRFNIVPFSSSAEPWQKGLVSAKERRAEGVRFAETLLAQGGTDIAGALDAALQSLPREGERPSFIVFMTDGKPTMGETTDPKRILAKIDRARGAKGGESIRLFTWGVGFDVDTFLLDAMASRAGGASEYVRPEEDIEIKVSAFANKASQPVLTGLELQVLGEKVQLANRTPNRIPDLYAGSQLVLFGRYTGEGDVALRLTGRVNGKEETFTYEGKFSAAERTHGFVEILWAQRRIGQLLDQIRLDGETKEIVDDVIRLSKEYGIQTPYTSQLILENPQQRNLDAPRARFGAGGGKPMADAVEKKLDELKVAPAPTTAAPVEEAAKREASLTAGFRQKDGKAGVEAAMALRQLKETDKVGGGSEVRRAAGTRFLLHRGLWVDERFDAEAQTTCVKFGGEAYFKLIEREPALIAAFKLGTDVLVRTAEGKALVVCQNGEEKLTDAQIEDLFKAKK